MPTFDECVEYLASCGLRGERGSVRYLDSQRLTTKVTANTCNEGKENEVIEKLAFHKCSILWSYNRCRELRCSGDDEIDLEITIIIQRGEDLQ